MGTAYRMGKKPEDVEVRFRRDLGLLEITMIGLGPTVGTTIFLLVGPGLVHVPLLPYYLRLLEIMDTPPRKRKGKEAAAGVGTGPTPAATLSRASSRSMKS